MRQVQNPRYKNVTLNAYTSAKIIEQCVGVLSSSARIRSRTCEFMDKTPQIAEKQFVMTMDKAQETKLQRYKVSVSVFFFCFFFFFSLTSAKAKKFQDGDRSIRLYSPLAVVVL